MKKTLPYLISYCFVILLTLFLIIAYRQVFFVMILFAAILFPLLSIYITIRYIERRIHFEVTAECESVEEGNPIRIRIDAPSECYCYPLIDCGVSFEAQNLFFSNPRQYHLSFPILPRKKNTVYIPIDTSHPGLIQMNVHSFYITDLSHLYQKEIPFDSRITVTVLPKEISVYPVLPTPGSDALDEFAEFDNRGTPSSDVKEIREYHPGDRLQRIHWKLSAKLDDLFVKVMEQTSTISFIVLPELSRPLLHDTLTSFYSLSKYLLTKEERYQVCLYQYNLCDFEYILITDEARLHDCFVHLCYLSLYDETHAALDNYKLSGQKPGILIHLVGKEINIEEYGID